MPTQNLSEQIYNHALRFIEPFSSEPGATWAAIPTGPLTHQAWPLASAQFRDWLAHSFHNEHSIYPGHQSLRHAIRMIQARARFAERPREEVFTRIAFRGDRHRPQSLTIDLANPAHEAVEITSNGWRITTREGWRFRPVAGSRPLPAPRLPDSRTPGLLDSLNLPAATLSRLTTWLFTALRPAGPYPILILTGPPASGKSTTARILRSLLDPNITPLQALPHSERELFVSALHNRVLAFDHVPSLTRDQSVAIARLAAGTAFTHHGHHPFDDPLPLAIERPVIITVPYSEATASHWSRNRTIASIAMTVKLDALEPERMLSHHEFERNIELATPAILANLCEATSAALTNMKHSTATRVGRFIDAHLWTSSAANALGLTQEEVNAAMAGSPLIRALTDLLNEEGEWTGTATDLLLALQSRSVQDLPTTAKVLSEHLNATPLAVFGIDSQVDRKTNERRIKLTMTQAHFGASFSATSCVMN